MRNTLKSSSTHYYLYRHDGSEPFTPADDDISVYNRRITIDNNGKITCKLSNSDYLFPGFYSFIIGFEYEGNIYYGEMKTFEIGGICPDGNHPHMIDLGLPSGTKWCCCNEGASKPEEYGGYYAWGEKNGNKNEYSIKTYEYKTIGDYMDHWDDPDPWFDQAGIYFGYENEDNPEDYCTYAMTDIGSEISGTFYDVAFSKSGGNRRMPTLSEFEELGRKCTGKETSYNGIAGWLITGPNGNRIFLPAGGFKCGKGYGDSLWYNDGKQGTTPYLWSGTINEYSKGEANSYYWLMWGGLRQFARYYGLPVRAVCP